MPSPRSDLWKLSVVAKDWNVRVEVGQCFQCRRKSGSAVDFRADVDANGNRFNPNKLLLDPYALEVSHCVQTPDQHDRGLYASGDVSRATDTGGFAPKGIVLPSSVADYGVKPVRPFRDDIIHEAHLRGFTKADESIPADLRGTYAGAAKRAPYLAALGVTAIEFLPVHQTQNALNDLPQFAKAHNYWGYNSMSFMAPDRRYSFDQSPGGPTREWIAMVKAFHNVGIKVFIDVVFNHHEEVNIDASSTVGTIYSLRGLNNSGYYELAEQSGTSQTYQNDNGVGPNINTAATEVRHLVLASLHYWSKYLGVDGFRFDLAAILGNSKSNGGYAFDPNDPDNILNRAVMTALHCLTCIATRNHAIIKTSLMARPMAGARQKMKCVGTTMGITLLNKKRYG
jgi:isoamylase